MLRFTMMLMTGRLCLTLDASRQDRVIENVFTPGTNPAGSRDHMQSSCVQKRILQLVSWTYKYNYNCLVTHHFTP